MENEIWKPILGFEKYYEVSNLGRVRSFDIIVGCKNGKTRLNKGRIIKTKISSRGYVQIDLKNKHKKIHTGIHRLIAIAFIPNTKNKPQVNHKDGNKLNNSIDNLEWVTNKENAIHAVKNNLHNPNYGENHHMAKLKNSDVLKIRKMLDGGKKIGELSVMYKISFQSIWKIKENKSYKIIT